MGLGRPTDYSSELAERICAAIAESDVGLHHICASRDDLPAWRTAYRWLEEHEDFRQKYARAREQQADYVAAQGASCIREAPASKEELMRARELAHHYRWQGERLAPRKWGARQVIAGDPDAPLRVQTIHDLVKQVDE